jgi:L-lactate dehydrogenase complex protein LldG
MRDRILQRLRASRPMLPPSEPRPVVHTVTASVDEQVARFAVEAAALGIECFVELTASDVVQRVATMARSKRVLSWDADQLPYGVGLTLEGTALGSDPRERQAAAELGITGCDAAIAETASVVLLSGRGRSRAVSLLPPVHLAIVQRHQLCLTMAEVFEKYSGALQSAASCTLITGPSRTADIELTLTLGIHGPGRVVVVIGP